ncbi:hypothetical protein [Rubripirellula reticaptiva]|uniref:Uncharacterized protein n=1 Tax=Rubripirellula reticaptiva TaxID=2528013 RepID=A0A5C6EIV6_9BACT|nr:hypothetical protein [Rubripirellula reticaptiva]TWU49683.1 hypothetical protein Poly59_43050 [Rubripirellula reticaptiva]
MINLQYLSGSMLSLLAETKMSDVSLNYREEVAPSGIWSGWYVLVPVVIAMVAGLAYRFADRPPAIVNTPLGMLHELCRVHRIKGRSRILLETIAEAASLEHPATMFLSSGHLDDAFAQAKKRIAFDKKQMSTLGMVRRRMFA